MSSTYRNSNTNIVGFGAGATSLEAIARRWRITSRGIGKAVAGIRDPRVRADIRRLIDAYSTGNATEPTSLADERAQALAAVCAALLQQFESEQAGAAEIRLVVHKRDELPGEPPSGLPPESRAAVDAEEGELVWELRRLLASSGGTIADVAHALEKRGLEIARKDRELLQDEVYAVEADLAGVKALLSDPVDWDSEWTRLVDGDIPPFRGRVDDDDEDVDDDD